MWRAVLLSAGLVLAGCGAGEVPVDAIKYEYPPPADTSEWGPNDPGVLEIKAMMLNSGQVQAANEGRAMDEVRVDGDGVLACLGRVVEQVGYERAWESETVRIHQEIVFTEDLKEVAGLVKRECSQVTFQIDGETVTMERVGEQMRWEGGGAVCEGWAVGGFLTWLTVQGDEDLELMLTHLGELAVSNLVTG